MRDIFQRLTKIFDTMKNKTDRIDELITILQDTINRCFPEYKCLKIYKSFTSNDPFYALVIPTKYRVLPYGDKELCMPGDYYIDLDINMITRPTVLGGLKSEEAAAWLLHELLHNVLTSTTRLRMQMLIMSTVEPSKYNLYSDHINNLISGSYFWGDIHSRTYKEIIHEETIKFEADRALLFADISGYWNDSLRKYIDAHGGDYKIATEEYIDSIDKCTMKYFNELIREEVVPRKPIYPSDAVRTIQLKEYVTNNLQSQLIKAMLLDSSCGIFSVQNFTDPNIIDEKDSFNMISDPRILTESAEVLNEGIFFHKNKFDYNKALRKIDEISFEMEDIRNVDDKIAIMYQLRNQLAIVEKYIKKEPNNELLNDVKTRILQLLEDLKKYEIKEKQYGVFLKGVPAGYEG